MPTPTIQNTERTIPSLCHPLSVLRVVPGMPFPFQFSIFYMSGHQEVILLLCNLIEDTFACYKIDIGHRLPLD
jgi:hypothetical protein